MDWLTFMNNTLLQRVVYVQIDINKFILKIANGRECFYYNIKFNMRELMMMRCSYVVAINKNVMTSDLNFEYDTDKIILVN